MTASRLFTSLFSLAVLALSVSVAKADTLTGTAYHVPSSTSDNVPTIGNVPGMGATVEATFNSTGAMFSGDQNYSLGGFLNSFGVANNISYKNGYTATSTLTDTLFEFTGNAFFKQGQTYNVYHDDGVNLYVGGKLVLGDPGVTAPVNSTFTFAGASGNYAIDYIYANGPVTQADFQTPLANTVTPEPSSIALLGSGLLGLAGMVRRRYNSARATA